MKNLLGSFTGAYRIIFITLFVNAFCFNIYASEVRRESVLTKITTQELKDMLKSGDIELIDVRSTEEFLSKHVEEARNIPLPILDLTQIYNKNNKIVLQCASGARSTLAAKKLKSLEPNLDIYILNDGINSCEKSGHNIVKNSTEDKLPIMRQVQIVAGSIIVLGAILTIFVSKAFIIIPLFVGSGLIFAGISGWCGMAKLLALMPWN